MKRCAGFAFVLCLCAVSLSGCGGVKVPDEVRETSVAVNGRGQISAWLVEDFAEDYYSLAELTRMAEDEAAEFNGRAGSGGKAAVTVEKVELLAGDREKIVVCYRFDSWAAYTGFGDGSLFYGTVEEAAEEGYSTNVILRSVTDETLLAGEGMKQAADRDVIITDVKAKIYCPGKVTHVSSGVLVNEDGSIDTRGIEGTVYILMK